MHFNFLNVCHIYFWTDLNAPDSTDILMDESRSASEPKIDDTWLPYESKMVK